MGARIVGRIRGFIVHRFPRLAAWLRRLRRRRPAALFHQYYPHAFIAHHSQFSQMLSFLASDSLWGLPMEKTKKTLFLYDITFFEILRMITSPALHGSSPFIVGHIVHVGRAISESHSIMVPTHYLAGQLPRHFPAARACPIDVVPLASTMAANVPMRFFPLRRGRPRNSALIVCGFDGFQNDNKGMGALLDVIALHERLFEQKKPLRFMLVTPRSADLTHRIEELGIQNRVTVKSGLQLEDLIQEYQRAKFLWVHSIDEGFCLPVLEASQLHVPVLASDIPSLREIWGDAIDYINPFNRYEAVNTLHAYCLGQAKAAKGAHAARAKNYTIEKSVDGVWSALAKAARA